MCGHPGQKCSNTHNKIAEVVVVVEAEEAVAVAEIVTVGEAATRVMDRRPRGSGHTLSIGSGCMI